MSACGLLGDPSGPESIAGQLLVGSDVVLASPVDDIRRKLRRRRLIPAIVYGGAAGPVSVAINSLQRGRADRNC